MGHGPSKGSAHPAPSSSDAAAAAGAQLSQVLGLVEAPPGEGPGGARLQQHRRSGGGGGQQSDGFAASWQLEVIRQTKTIHKCVVPLFFIVLDGWNLETKTY